MDSTNIQKMIYDLQSMNASSEEALPDDMLDSVLQRIADEPARVTSDRAGDVTAVNPAFCGMCGFSFGEIRGRKPGSLLQGSETSAESIQIIREAVVAGKDCSTPMVNYHKNGSRYDVDIQVKAICDDYGAVVGFEAEERKLS